MATQVLGRFWGTSPEWYYMIAMIAYLINVTDNALPAERLKAFLLIARGMANFTSEIDLLKL